MKKTNTKTKSPAPATAVTKPAKKKAATTATAKPTATPTVVPPVKLHIGANGGTPAVKPVASKPVQTKIVAKVDVGFGNALYVRGDGPGLSWDQGLRMDCVANDQWELTLGEAARPVAFKVLLNDSTWCAGPDNTVLSGNVATVTPEFL